MQQDNKTTLNNLIAAIPGVEIETTASTTKVFFKDTLLATVDYGAGVKYLITSSQAENFGDDTKKVVANLNGLFVEKGRWAGPIMGFREVERRTAPPSSAYTYIGAPFADLDDRALDYCLPKGIPVVLECVHRAASVGEKEVVLLTGPTGAGKSFLAEYYARRFNLPLFTEDMGVVRDPLDLIGHKELENDGTGMRLRFEYSHLVKALQTPNAVILLDEANRVPAHVLNSLFPLLDHRGQMHIPGAPEPVSVAPGVTFFLTMNLGSAYAGVHATDAAFLSRVTRTLEVGYLPANEEIALLERRYGVSKKDATLIVRIAEKTRIAESDPSSAIRTGLSTRDTLKCAQMVGKGGASVGTACEATFVYNYPNVGEKSARAEVLQILAAQGARGALIA